MNTLNFLFAQRFNFIFLLILAIIISWIPIINWPFGWLATFFHEFSHGAGALLTGGSIEKITLHIKGSGVCITRGGWVGLITFSGYIGAAVWGALIFHVANTWSKKYAQYITYGILALLISTLLFWARDLITWAILLLIIGIFISFLYLKNDWIMKKFLKFCGLFVVLDAIKSPTYLFDGRHFGDGAKLADLTGLWEGIWVGIWLFFGLFTLYHLWKCQHPDKSTTS